MADAIIDSLYASFKGQVVVTEIFRKGFGELEKDLLIKSVNELQDEAQEVSSFDPL